MAYVLGFFMADGSMDITKRGGHYFSIQICDRPLLVMIRKALGSNHKISVRKRYGNEHDIYRIQIGSKDICADLRKLGLSTQKTFNLSLPPMPKRYLGSFIRGYFDGDGNVWTGYIHKYDRPKPVPVMQAMFTSGCKSFLESLHVRLKDENLRGGGVYCKERGFCLKYSTRDALVLYDLLYADISDRLYLKRKKRVFEKFIQKRTRKNAVVV
jgi:hypothetical protein